MKDIKPQQLAVIVAIIVVAAVFFVLRAEVTAELAKSHGPGYVAANDKTIFVAYEQGIIELNLEGQVTNRTNLDVLAEDIEITDMQATSGHLYLGDRWASAIYECDFSLMDCHGRIPADGSVKTPFKFFVDERNNLWISEGPRNRLLFAKAGSRRLRKVSLDGKGLNQANRILVQGDQVIVADTDHHRTVIYRLVEDDKLNLLETQVLQAMDHPKSADGNTYPSDVAWVDGKWWVLTGKPLHKDAALLSYSQEGKPLGQANLPDGADVNAVSAGSGALYLADMGNYRVLKVDPKTGVSESFGDAEFLQIMAEGRAKRDSLAQQAMFYLMGMIATMVVGFGFAIWFERHKLKKEGLAGAFTLASKENKAQSQVVADESDPELQWFIPDQKRMKNLARLNYLILGTSIAMMLLYGWLLFSLAGKNVSANLIPMSVIMLFVIVFMPGMAFLVMRLHKRRLGFKGRSLFLRDQKMRVREVPVEDVVYSKRGISHQDLFVVLVDGKGKPFYSEKTLNFLFDDLLLPAKKLNDWQMSLYQLKYRQPVIVAVVVFIVFGAALMLLK